MRVHIVAMAMMAGLLAAGCSGDPAPAVQAASSVPEEVSRAPLALDRRIRGTKIAGWPDRGRLVEYDRSTPPVQRGASVWHPVRLSEERALRSISRGGMVIEAPDGRPLRVAYERHVEHKDGNWTWVGQRADDKSGAKTVITFGEKAVFGSLATGEGEALQLTTVGGRTWMVQTDAKAIREPAIADSVAPVPAALLSAGRSRTETKRIGSASDARMSGGELTATATTTVDVLLGYTPTFAARFGGESQAVTRLNFLVEIANVAYAESQVDGRVRMVHAMQVDYPDTTSNQNTLFELTGVTCTASNSGSRRLPDRGFNCSSTPRPAALQPLISAREQFGADLVSLVRTFQSPENGSCGAAWLLGAGQTPIDSESAAFAFSVVSDSNGTQAPDDGTTCREEYLAHELGHNMGLQHDREIAQASDDTNNDSILLDPEEFGALPYSFGHRVDSTSGNFYTIMAVRRAGQSGFRVFSNPRISTCGNFPCGVADQADNARALGQTMPLVASFRTATVALPKAKSDVDGDGRSDLLWYRPTDGVLGYWIMNGSSVTRSAFVPVGGQFRVVASGDFNGDGRLDLIWNRPAGDMQFWAGDGANFAQRQFLATYPLEWTLVGAGDVDGDGRSDLVWHRASDGRLAYWIMDGANVVRHGNILVGGTWRIIAMGDFNGDNKVDLVWNRASGDMQFWAGDGADFAQRQGFATYPAGWNLAGIADIDGDAKSDLVWHRPTDGTLAYWILSGPTVTRNGFIPVGGDWRVETVRDFNADGFGDLIWNRAAGDMQLWQGDGSQFSQRGAFTTYPAGWELIPTGG